MAAVRDKWTDERLDDLNHRVEIGFDRVDSRFDSVDRRFDAVDRRFDSLEARLDSMQRVMLQGVIALVGAILVGFGGIIALIATQI